MQIRNSDETTAAEGHLFFSSHLYCNATVHSDSLEHADHIPAQNVHLLSPNLYCMAPLFLEQRTEVIT